MHQAIAFAIASEFCRKRPFTRNFCSEDKMFAISFAKPIAWLANPSQRLIRNFLFEIWWLKFASEFSGRVRIRIRIHSCIAATAVHSREQKRHTRKYLIEFVNKKNWTPRCHWRESQLFVAFEGQPQDTAGKLFPAPCSILRVPSSIALKTSRV